MKDFKVSVIIPVYKAEKYLEKAVLSAIGQPETAEVLLIEDSSPDNSLKICESLALQYENVKLIGHPDKTKNYGAAASRNLGIKSASFPYLAFLDADDYYLPNRFSKAKKILMEQSDFDGVYEAIGTKIYDKEIEEFHLRRMEETKIDIPSDLTTLNEVVNPEDLFEVLLFCRKGWFHFNGLTLKSSVIKKSGLLDDNMMYGEDMDFFYKLALKGCLVPGDLNNPVAMRGVYNGNSTLSIYTSEKRYKVNVFYTSMRWRKLFNEMLNNNFKKKINRFILLRYLDYYSTEFYLSKVTLYRKIVKGINLLKILINHPGIIKKIM